MATQHTQQHPGVICDICDDDDGPLPGNRRYQCSALLRTPGCMPEIVADTHYDVIICDICDDDKPICGTRYSCVTCGDYDLCQKCYGQHSRTQHDPTHRFYGIPKHGLDKATWQVAPQAQMPFHEGVICDRCDDDAPIKGIRFMCQGCSDYDLCSKCYAIRTQFHSASHKFTSLEWPKVKPSMVSRRGDVHMKKQEFDQAIADYTEAIRLKPDDHFDFHNRGSAHVDKQEYDQAIADYTEAIRLKPDYHLAFRNRGVAHWKNQDSDQAIADYTEAIRLKPDDHLAFRNRAVAHWKKEEYDQAIADFTKAVRLKPDDHLAFRNRGDAHAEKQEYNQAIADYTEAIRLKPDDHLAFQCRAFVSFQKHDCDRAVADYAEAIRLQPDDPNVFHSRGTLWLTHGRLDLAGADFREAVRLRPKNPQYRNGLAMWHLSMEDFSEALKHAEQALCDCPAPNGTFIGNHARVLLCLGNPAQALRGFDTALELIKKHREADLSDILLYYERHRAVALLHLERPIQIAACLKMLDENVAWEFVALAISFQAHCLWTDESKAKSDWSCIVHSTRRRELLGSVDTWLSFSIRFYRQLMLLLLEERKDLSPYLIFLKSLWNEDPSREQARLVKSVQWFVRLFDAELESTKKDLRLDVLQELIDRFVARRSLTIECSYVKACHAFVEDGLLIPKHWFDHTQSQCYCDDCLRGQTVPNVRVEPQGASPGFRRRCSFPSGWVKFGLPVSPNDKGGAKNVFTEWCQAYHGTSDTSVKAILHCGTLLRAGDVTPSGHELQMAPGHISYKDVSDPSLRAELKSFVRSRFVSPSLKYASVYGRKKRFQGRDFQIVFEVRIPPGAFRDSLPANTSFFDPGQQHTLPSSFGFSDPLFPTECLEWFTDREGVIVLTGMMVKMSGGSRRGPLAEEEEEGEVVPERSRVESTTPDSGRVHGEGEEEGEWEEVIEEFIPDQDEGEEEEEGEWEEVIEEFILDQNEGEEEEEGEWEWEWEEEIEVIVTDEDDEVVVDDGGSAEDEEEGEVVAVASVAPSSQSREQLLSSAIWSREQLLGTPGSAGPGEGDPAELGESPVQGLDDELSPAASADRSAVAPPPAAEAQDLHAAGLSLAQRLDDADD